MFDETYQKSKAYDPGARPGTPSQDIRLGMPKVGPRIHNP